MSPPKMLLRGVAACVLIASCGSEAKPEAKAEVKAEVKAEPEASPVVAAAADPKAAELPEVRYYLLSAA